MGYWFVEYARAVRAIKIALILLGIFFAIALILRASLHDRSNLQAEIVNSSTAHVTKTTLPNGDVRTVVDDPAKQTHAVIVTTPNGGIDIDATQPKSAKTDRHMDFVMGSTSMSQTNQGGTVHTRMRYRHETPTYNLGVLFLITIPMGLIVASMLGGVLSKENDGHLELAWTKPVSRERYALSAIAVDAGAIAASQLLTIAVGLLATLMFFIPHFGYEQQLGWYIVYSLAGPLAWYALVTAASASLKRGPGMVIGLGWVVALIVPSVAAALHDAAAVNSIAAGFYAIFKGLSYIDPLAYLSFNGGKHGATLLISLTQSSWALCALVAGYVALAVLQWRRAEA